MKWRRSSRISSQEQPESLSRRDLIKGAGLSSVAVVGLLAKPSLSQNEAGIDAPSNSSSSLMRPLEAFETLTADESVALEALCSRILPSDDLGPGAKEARVVHYIDRAISGVLANAREQYSAGLAALDLLSNDRYGERFSLISIEQQDEVIEDMTLNKNLGYPILNLAFFNMVRNHTIEGAFSDPYYGGNRNFIGWDILGYPGVRVFSSVEDVAKGRNLPASRQSAYDMPAHTKDPVNGSVTSKVGAANGH